MNGNNPSPIRRNGRTKISEQPPLIKSPDVMLGEVVVEALDTVGDVVGVDEALNGLPQRVQNRNSGRRVIAPQAGHVGIAPPPLPATAFTTARMRDVVAALERTRGALDLLKVATTV